MRNLVSHSFNEGCNTCPNKTTADIWTASANIFAEKAVVEGICLVIQQGKVKCEGPAEADGQAACSIEFTALRLAGSIDPRGAELVHVAPSAEQITRKL